MGCRLKAALDAAPSPSFADAQRIVDEIKIAERAKANGDFGNDVQAAKCARSRVAAIDLVRGALESALVRAKS